MTANPRKHCDATWADMPGPGSNPGSGTEEPAASTRIPSLGGLQPGAKSSRIRLQGGPLDGKIVEVDLIGRWLVLFDGQCEIRYCVDFADPDHLVATFEVVDGR